MPASVLILVPLAGMCVVIVAIYTEHRQKMAMIEKGIKPEELRKAQAPRPEGMLIGGLVLIGIGFAFLLAQILGELNKWIYVPSFFFLFIGIALMISYYLIKKSKKEG